MRPWLRIAGLSIALAGAFIAYAGTFKLGIILIGSGLLLDFLAKEKSHDGDEF